ncbi:MAG: hypothetical protein JNK14_14465 [Chitinophagaceae bacterium]|nr:hypothetical protein [Chitinophagaceae bacterium]
MMIKVKYKVLPFFLLLSWQVDAQHTPQTVLLLCKLDSIRNSPSVARHFAGIYFETTAHAVSHFSSAEPAVQDMMGRMEWRFADYFFRSADASKNKTPVSREWMAYYSDNNASSLRYLLLGINAHINGDIWQALTTEFTKEELEKLKPHYFSYYTELLKEYRRVSEQAWAQSKKLRLLHTISFGMDKWYGKIMLKRWRKRQMNLAGLYFTNRSLFEKKLEQVRRKMIRLEHLIRRNT